MMSVALKIGEWLDLDENSAYLKLTERNGIYIISWLDRGRRVWSIDFPHGSRYQGMQFRDLGEAKIFAVDTLRARCAEVLNALDMVGPA